MPIWHQLNLIGLLFIWPEREVGRWQKQPTFQLNKSLEENTHFLSEFQKICSSYKILVYRRSTSTSIENWRLFILYTVQPVLSSQYIDCNKIILRDPWQYRGWSLIKETLLAIHHYYTIITSLADTFEMKEEQGLSSVIAVAVLSWQGTLPSARWYIKLIIAEKLHGWKVHFNHCNKS